MSERELLHWERQLRRQAVTGDSRHDFAEEELNLWFDDSSVAGVMIVRVQDLD